MSSLGVSPEVRTTPLRKGQTQDQIANDLRPAIEAALDDLGRLMASTAI
jgi:hypothetical protein